MAKIIEVADVSKSFRIPSVKRETVRDHLFGLFRPRRSEELRVLDSISFDVEAGESFGIVGRNGCGKSTLLKILAGIYRPATGEVTMRAPVTPILELGLGWNGELNARDNVMLTGTAMGVSLRELRRAMDEILAFAELERFADLELKFFSSGMAARLAYAVAFRAVNEIILLDEIFAVGDAAFQDKCKRRCRELKAAGHTILLVSHSPYIAEFCDRAILIEGGRIVRTDVARHVIDAYHQRIGHG